MVALEPLILWVVAGTGLLHREKVNPPLTLTADIDVPVLHIVERSRFSTEVRPRPVSVNRRPSDVFWLASLLVAFSQPMVATSIVALRTSVELVVAADSKVKATDGATPLANECKISQLDRFFFVAGAGLLYVEGSNYNMATLAKEAFSGVGSVKFKINRFEELMNIRLSGAVKSIATSPRTKIPTNGTLDELLNAQVILAGLEGETPVLYLRVWTARRGDNGVIEGVDLIKKIDCPPECAPSGFLLRVGEADAIDTFMKSRPDFLTKQPMANSARQLVQLEIEAQPDIVGPPIDVLRIVPGKATWVSPQKGSQCWQQ